MTVHLQPQDLLCRDHNRWIGRSWSRRDTQPRLTNHPEITRANKHHRGTSKPTGPMQEQRRHQHLFDQFLARYHPPGTSLALPDPTVEASAYPQTIALTRILASPHWSQLPFGTDDDRTAFQDEVRAP